MPRAIRRSLRLSSSTSKECVRQRLLVLLLHTEPKQRTPDYGASRREVEGCCLEHGSLVGEHTLTCKTIVLRTFQIQLSECVHACLLPLWCLQFVKGFLHLNAMFTHFSFLRKAISGVVLRLFLLWRDQLAVSAKRRCS